MCRRRPAAGISIGVYQFGFIGYFQRLQQFNACIWKSAISAAKVGLQQELLEESLSNKATAMSKINICLSCSEDLE